MLSFLKNHPFGVEAIFERSLVFTFAVQKDEIQNLIPPCLQLDTFNDNWAFIAIAMVKTKSLRPKGFSSIFGNDFFLVGYRVFVRYVNKAGKRLRGLYILKSETDKRKMEFLGNIFTQYNYTTTDIHQEITNNKLEISSIHSDFSVIVGNMEKENVTLPIGSPFQDWKEARRFAGPLPFTFSYYPKTNRVLIIEGVRESWTPKPLHVINYYFSFLNDMKLTDLKLASVFVIENIAYSWKKGKQELWKPA